MSFSGYLSSKRYDIGWRDFPADKFPFGKASLIEIPSDEPEGSEAPIPNGGVAPVLNGKPAERESLAPGGLLNGTNGVNSTNGTINPEFFGLGSLISAVAPTALNLAGKVLGPAMTSLVGTVGNMAVSALAGAVGQKTESFNVNADLVGTPHRAIMAQSSLDALNMVMSHPGNEELVAEILARMEPKIKAVRETYELISPVLAPVVKEAVSDVVLFQQMRPNGSPANTDVVRIPELPWWPSPGTETGSDPAGSSQQFAEKLLDRYNQVSLARSGTESFGPVSQFMKNLILGSAKGTSGLSLVLKSKLLKPTLYAAADAMYSDAQRKRKQAGLDPWRKDAPVWEKAGLQAMLADALLDTLREIDPGKLKDSGFFDLMLDLGLKTGSQLMKSNPTAKDDIMKAWEEWLNKMGSDKKAETDKPRIKPSPSAPGMGRTEAEIAERVEAMKARYGLAY